MQMLIAAFFHLKNWYDVGVALNAHYQYQIFYHQPLRPLSP